MALTANNAIGNVHPSQRHTEPRQAERPRATGTHQPLFKNSEDDPAAEITAGPPVRQGQGGPMQRLCQKLTIKPLRLYWGPAI